MPPHSSMRASASNNKLVTINEPPSQWDMQISQKTTGK